MNPPSPHTAKTRLLGVQHRRHHRRGQPGTHRRQGVVEQQCVRVARAVAAREPDLVHAVVERDDAVGRHHLAHVADDALRRQREARLLGAGKRPLDDVLAQRDQRAGVRQLALDAIGQQGQARPEIADDLGMREVHLLHVGRRVADVDHLRSLRAHDEGGLLDRVVANGQDQVGPVDRLVHVVAVGQRGRSHPQLGSAFGGAQTGDRSLAHLRVEERNADAANEIRQLAGEPGAAGRSAEHHQRPLGSHQQVRGPVERGGVRHRDLDRVRPDQRHVLVQLLARDVLGKFEMHRAGTLFRRQAECVAHDGRNAGGADDLA